MLEILQDFFINYGYYAVFAILILSGLGIPFPEDITLVAAGAIAGLGFSNVHCMALVSFAGVILGDWIVYFFGARYGMKITNHRLFSKVLSAKRLSKVELLCSRYKHRVIFGARFVAGLRTPVFFVAGLSKKISFIKFTLVDGLGALISVPAFVYLGYYGAENSEWLTEKIKEFKYLSIFLLLLFVAFVLRHLWKKRKRAAAIKVERQKMKAARNSRKKVSY